MRVRRGRFLRDFYHQGQVCYREGVHYPITDIVRSQIVGGAAEEVEVSVGLVGYLLHLLESAIAEQQLPARSDRASAEPRPLYRATISYPRARLSGGLGPPQLRVERSFESGDR